MVPVQLALGTIHAKKYMETDTAYLEKKTKNAFLLIKKK